MPDFMVGSVLPMTPTLTLQHIVVEKYRLRMNQNLCPLLADRTYDKVSRTCARHRYENSFTGSTLNWKKSSKISKSCANHILFQISLYQRFDPICLHKEKQHSLSHNEDERDGRKSRVPSSKTYSTLNTLAPFLLPAFLRLLPFSKAVASCSVLPRLSGFLTL